MRRQDKYPDNEYFRYYNANSHNHKTGDCVVRALCTACNISWEECATELFNIGIKKGYTMLEDKVIDKFLENHGFMKCKEPRTYNNTKMCVRSWLDKNRIYYKKYKIVANVGSHHIVAIIDGQVNDIWDSSKQTMHKYWIKMI